jgi:hypothetical protein
MMRELGGGFAFSAAWLLCWAAASVAWRLLKGKPVFYRRPSAVRFREWNGSGNSCRNWFTRLAGANGCLVVQVTDAGLDIHPFVPFNWMFLPEILGIEHRVPLKDVLSVTPLPDDRTLDFTVLRKFVKRRGVEVEILSPAGERETVRLWLKRRDGFLAALGVPPAGRPGRPAADPFRRMPR